MAKFTMPKLLPYGIALASTALVTALAWLLRSLFHVPDIEMLYVVVVAVIALAYGRGPSLITALASVLLYDLLFVPPYFTLRVDDARYFLTFSMLIGAALFVSELAGRLRIEASAARMREAQTLSLYALTRDLGSAESTTSVLETALAQACDAFQCPCALLYDDGWQTRKPETTAHLNSAPALQASLIAQQKKIATLAAYPVNPLLAEQKQLWEAFVRQVVSALERVELARQAREALLKAHIEEQRSALLESVSHDLRTPLGVLTGIATTLRAEVSVPKEVEEELLDAMVREAARLERFVENLLRMSRLQDGKVALRREWVPLVEIVGAVFSRYEAALSNRSVTIAIPDDLPLIFVDPVSLEQLLANLLENAIKYAGEGVALQLAAKVEEGTFVLSFADRGAGLPLGSEERLFERFERGTTRNEGAGLGLAICRAIAEAHEGSLVARNENGAVFELRLPQGEPPQMESL